MSDDGAHRRRKSTRRRRTDPSTPLAEHHKRRRKHGSVVPPDSETLEQPTTLDDLREARLKYIATPQEERSKKMKYVYEERVKESDAAKLASAKLGSGLPKTKSTTRSRSRKSTTGVQKVEPIPEDEDAEYVYSAPRSRQHVPGAFETTHTSSEDHAERAKATSRQVKVSRRKTERRHTEPAKSSVSTSKESKAQTSSRPSLRKSTTALPERPAPPRRSSSAVTRTATEVAASVTAPTAPRKSASVLGSLFGARTQPADRRVSCLTCGDDVPTSRSAKLPCTHRMCHPCLKRLFKLAVSDPAHMPPRCCTDQPISLKHVEGLFDNEFKKNYNRKFKEFSTKDKIYCPARECGEWIQPKHITMDKGRKTGRCPTCKTCVCGICGQKMHRTRDCPKDPALKEFVETAQKEGWKKCYNCSAMVELKEGCNHMTCRCTAEFCMMCGLKWKSCDCPWFNYEQADVNGDPVRYQQELDRRREQEARDEAIARRLEALQVDDDRPARGDWVWQGRRPGRGTEQPFIHDARDAPTADLVEGNEGARGLRSNHSMAGHDDTPIMPGGWDDGPRQFEQLPPQLPRPLPRRHQRAAFDPAAVDLDAAIAPERNGAPLWQHRAHRRRETAAAAADAFEGRILTTDERDQQRRIRAWATGTPDDR